MTAESAPRISFESKCVAHVSAIELVGGEIVRQAPCTGFFWRDGNRVFLITCRHCLTGRNELNVPIEGSFDPTHVRLSFFYETARVSESVASYTGANAQIKLWNEGKPTWQEHPDGRMVDVVALQVTRALQIEPYAIKCINDREQVEHWFPEAGDDCFIVGYPEGLAGAGRTPIWKRGSLATEPSIDFKELPIFLVDSPTRKGLSGAPIIARPLGAFDKAGRPLTIGGSDVSFFGSWSFFLGVYAGRNGTEEEGFQLGRAWRGEVLDSIIANTDSPSSPFKVFSPSP